MKHLKAWSIITFIFCVGLFTVLFLCVFRNPEFGAFLVNIYEDITCDLGHTVEGMYRILTFWVSCGLAGMFLINQVLLWACIKCANGEVDDEEVEVVDKPAVSVAAVSAPIEKKKKKAKKNSKHEAIDSIEATLNDVNKVANTSASRVESTNQALANFLDSFRK